MPSLLDALLGQIASNPIEPDYGMLAMQRQAWGSHSPAYYAGMAASSPPMPVKDRVRSMSGEDLDGVEVSIAWCRVFDDCWAD